MLMTFYIRSPAGWFDLNQDERKILSSPGRGRPRRSGPPAVRGSRGRASGRAGRPSAPSAGRPRETPPPRETGASAARSRPRCRRRPWPASSRPDSPPPPRGWRQKRLTVRTQIPVFSASAASTMTGAGSAASASLAASQAGSSAVPPLPEKAVDPPDPRPGADPFITDVIDLFPELPEEIHLQRAPRGEIRMAPLGGVFPPPRPRPGSGRPPPGRSPGRSPR